MTADSRSTQDYERIQMPDPVRWMRGLAFIYGLAFLGIGIIAALEDEPYESFRWTLAYIGLALYGVAILVGALRLRFEIRDEQILYRGFVSNIQVPIHKLHGVFVERYDGGIFFFLKGPRFVRVIVVQGEFGVKQLDGTAGREKNVQQIKQRILEHLPEDHPQRRRIGRGSGGVHRKRNKK